MDKCENTEFKILELLGKKHIFNIIQVLAFSKRALRYQEIHDQLKINTRTLTERLKDLVQYKLVHRISYDQIPPRVEYSLSDAAEDLKPIISAIQEFEKKHLMRLETEAILINSD